MIIGVKRWAIGVGVATVAAGFLGAMVGNWKPSPSVPKPPSECVSTAEIISAANSARTCEHGARLEVWPAGNENALIKCICPPVRP